MGYDYKTLKKFTKSQVNGLTKRLMSNRFKTDICDSTKMWDAIFKDAESIGLGVGYCGEYYGERLNFKNPRKITKEQTALGKNWLRDFYFKKNGEPRSGQRTQHLDDDVLKIVKKVSRFDFVGVAVLSSNGWYPVQVVPIYRAFDSKGNYFDYSPIHWGNPIIDEVHYRGAN